MKRLKELVETFCVWFTVILLGVIFIETAMRGELSRDYGNILVCFLWTAIGVGVLAVYPLFEKIPPLVFVILQYVVAMGLILLTVKISNWSEPYINPVRYKEAFLSFTFFYIFGAGIFYIQQRRSVAKQNKVLEEVKEMKKQKDE